MRTSLPIKTLWRSIASLFVLGLFVWLAAGSVKEETNYLGDGVYQTKVTSVHGAVKTITGKRDEYRNFHGPVKYENTDSEGKVSSEEVNLVHGIRHGKAKYTTSDHKVYYECYNLGHLIECQDKQQNLENDLTTYGILDSKYYWFLFDMESLYGDSGTVKVFLDSLDKILSSSVFEAEDFDEVFDDAIASVSSQEPLAEVAGIYEFSVDANGVTVLKFNELRRAVIDKNRQENLSTFYIFSTNYPNFYNLLLSAFSEADLEGFCDEVDTRMLAYSALDREDPLFLDSVDVRFNRVLNEILSDDTEKTDFVVKALEASESNDYKALRRLRNLARQSVSNKQVAADPSDVALIVALYMQAEIDQADPVRKAAREVWLPDEVRLPVVSTAFVDAASSGNATISGYVAESGGADVTQRGVAYATTYNPTIQDNTVLSGSGTGEFTVVLSGLTPGVTYHARAFATNSEGTAYGNNVEFTTDTGTGIVPVTIEPVEFSVYPVPAFKLIWVEFFNPDASETTVSLLNVAGRVLRNHAVDSLGNQKISLNVEGLRPGVYFVRLKQGGKVETRKVVLQ